MLLLSDRRHTVNDAIEGIQGEREERDHLSQSDKYLTPSPMNPQTAWLFAPNLEANPL